MTARGRVARGPAIAAVATTAAAATLGLASPAARAEPVTLPVSRFVVELPSTWHVQRASGARNSDTLRSTAGGSLAVGFTDGSCDAFFAAQAGAVGGAVTPATPTFAPSGWEVRAAGSGEHATFLGCHAIAGVTIAAQWWPLPEAEANDQSTWWSQMRDALGALDDLRRPAAAARRDSLVTLPGTGVVAQVPDALRVADGDPDARRDVLDLGPDAGEVQLRRVDQGTCDEAIAAGAAGATAQGDGPAGWKRWTAQGHDLYCIVASGTLVAIAPEGDEAARLLITSIGGELASLDAQPVAKLPATGFRAALPHGWAASGDGGADHLRGDGVEVVVRRAAGACADVVGGGGREPYAPSWLGSHWTATATADGSATVLCTEVARGHVELDAGAAALGGAHRHEVAALMTSLHDENDALEPVEPHHPLLPVPLGLALTTIGTDSRGWGLTGSLGVGLAQGHIVLRGQLGYDSTSGIAYDVRGGARVALGDVWAAYGVVGYDAIGTGPAPTVGGALYYGGGVELGKQDGRDAVWFHLELLGRSQPAGTDTMPLDEARYPPHEWRMGGRVSWGGDSLLQGVWFDYRSERDLGLWLVGIDTRL